MVQCYKNAQWVTLLTARVMRKSVMQQPMALCSYRYGSKSQETSNLQSWHFQHHIPHRMWKPAPDELNFGSPVFQPAPWPISQTFNYAASSTRKSQERFFYAGTLSTTAAFIKRTVECAANCPGDAKRKAMQQPMALCSRPATATKILNYGNPAS